jgi:hypothetical protein
MPFYGQAPASFSKSSRFAARDTSLKNMKFDRVTPGPGAYKESQTIGVNPTAGGQVAPGWSMRKRTNMQNNKNLGVPGPAAYDIKTSIGQKNIIYGTATSKTFSKQLAQKFNGAGNPLTPGPGAYNQEQKAIKTRNPVFSMRPKTVGNGARDIFIIDAKATGGNNVKDKVQEMIDAQARKGAQIRLPPLGQNFSSLGDGVTEITITFRQGWKTERDVKISQSGKPYIFAGESPGPGTHEPKMNNSVNSRKPRAPAYTMRKKTQDLLSKHQKETPGPKYNPIPQTIKPRAASYSMRKKLTSNKVEEGNPGPEKYTPNLTYVATRSPLAYRSRGANTLPSVSPQR